MDLWKEAYLGAESAQQVISETRMETGDSRKSGVSHTSTTLRWTRRKTRAKTARPWLSNMSNTPLRLRLTPCTLTPRMRTRSAPMSTTCGCGYLSQYCESNYGDAQTPPLHFPTYLLDWLNMCARIQSYTNREITSPRVPRQWTDSPVYNRWVRFTFRKTTFLQMS